MEVRIVSEIFSGSTTSHQNQWVQLSHLQYGLQPAWLGTVRIDEFGIIFYNNVDRL